MFLLFHGTDEFTAHEELAKLRATGGFDFNDETFYGEEADPAQIIALCDTMPFLSERRLVVVEGLPKQKRGAKSGQDSADDQDTPGESGASTERGASSTEDAAPAPEVGSSKEKGKSKRSKATTAAARDYRNPRVFAQALADYAPHLPGATTLVVIIGSMLEATHPLVKAAQQYGQVKTFTVPKGAQLESWLTRRARDNNARLTPDAARLLI
ncbi:MAG TPA: hypothetical protein VKQ36_08580, partial [Ktedonobacterales bacterium]|nr:hypothetical protein [Ktedonobacterales bacterium]